MSTQTGLGKVDLEWDETTRTLKVKVESITVLELTRSQLTVNGTLSGATVDADDLEFASEARGDVIRRGATNWERHSAKASGQILVGDGTDVASVAVSGDATLASTGALTVADVTVGSDAAGDLLYKTSATALTRLAKGSAGHILQSDGSIPSWGLALAANLDPPLTKYVKVAVSSAELLAINATPKTIVAAPGAGYTTVIHKVLLVLNYNSAAYANNGVLGLYETNAAGALLTGTLTLASFLAQVADTQRELHPTAASATTGLTRLDNKAVVLTQATGESITGNSPVDVHCWYSTVPNGL
ncbi:MAG: hypothetical protein AAB426_08340 [Myxococcota bacterium]